MGIDWDIAKAASNLWKHKVSFEIAATVFADPLAMSVLDEDHGLYEERWLTIGLAQDQKMLVVSHTFTEDENGRALIRIISARRATSNERRQYEFGK